jgi:hypothetical protein
MASSLICNPSGVEESLTSQKWLALVLQPIAGETEIENHIRDNAARVIPNPECFRGEKDLSER